MPDESPASQYRAYAANEADMPQSAAMSYSAAKGTMFLSDAVQEQHNFAIWERMTDYMDSRGMRCRDVFKVSDLLCASPWQSPDHPCFFSIV